MALNPRLRAKLERKAEQDRRMSREQREELAKLLPDGAVRFDEPSSAHSVAAVGGPAEAFVRARDLGQLKAVMAWAVEQGFEYRFWGRGSATLVREGGLPGLLIKLGEGFAGASVERSSGEESFVSVGAAGLAADLARWCAGQNLAGAPGFMRFAGTVGGALCSQKGEGESDFVDSIEELTILNKEGRELTLRRSALRFEEGRLRIPRTAVVMKVLIRLTPSVEAWAQVGEREDAGPRLTRVFGSPCKTSATIMIDEAGLTGVRVGGARVASDDANAIVNEGNATARDIVVLMSLVRDRVRQSTGVALTTLTEVVGER